MTRKGRIIFEVLINRIKLASQRQLEEEIGVSRELIGSALRDIANAGGLTPEKDAITPEGTAYMQKRLSETNGNGDGHDKPDLPPLQQCASIHESDQIRYRMAREVVDTVLCGSLLNFRDRSVVTPIRNRLIAQIHRTLRDSPESRRRATQLALELLRREEAALESRP